MFSQKQDLYKEIGDNQHYFLNTCFPITRMFKRCQGTSPIGRVPCHLLNIRVMRKHVFKKTMLIILFLTFTNRSTWKQFLLDFINMPNLITKSGFQQQKSIHGIAIKLSGPNDSRESLDCIQTPAN